MPTFFCIADDILIAGFNEQGRDYEKNAEEGTMDM